MNYCGQALSTWPSHWPYGFSLVKISILISYNRVAIPIPTGNVDRVG